MFHCKLQLSSTLQRAPPLLGDVVAMDAFMALPRGA